MDRHLVNHGIAAAVLLALANPMFAQSSNSCLPIGKHGAFGCQDPNSPVITNGVVATGDVDLTYDPNTGLLDIVVENTSPIVSGETNPVITRLAFNLPSGTVDAVHLVSQSGTGGATPDFDLDYDGSQSQHMGCLGYFDVELSVQGIQGGIGNPNASSFAHPTVVLGPVTFELLLQGPGIGSLTSLQIATATSQGGHPDVALALKFQGGGVNGAESGWVSNGLVCCPNSATVDIVGQGCAPTGLTVPTLTAIGVPMPGEPLGVDVSSPSTPNGLGLLAYGFSITYDPILMQSLPIDLSGFGFAGCTLLVSTEFSRIVPVDANGNGSHSFEIPPRLKWCGRMIPFQVFFLTNGGELLASAGLRQTIGS
ncbi:MAG: hypothetical protein KDE27_19550 [Planctomycetes bacterium]|nr:hypothetical protein [Planctomycetota bacterium]